MRDKNGREYLKWNAAVVGMEIEIDDGFTCQKAGRYTLQCDEVTQLLYFPCCEGRHYIEGQIEEEHLIGIYPV